MQILTEEFFAGEVVDTARNLLGKRLVRQVDGKRVSGIILETEAYRGEEDLACHARSGLTARNSMLFGKPGRAYIYFVYGMHWLFNAVCGAEGFPAAVLVRALQPDEGLEIISSRREGIKPADWCNGPARLCKALDITGALNGAVLFDGEGSIKIEDAHDVCDDKVRTTPRVGIQYAPEPWRSMPWRFVTDPSMDVTSL